MKTNAKTLETSEFDSDFNGGFFIGTQQIITSEQSKYTIGYIKYFSGALSGQDREDIVNRLANSWKE